MLTSVRTKKHIVKQQNILRGSPVGTRFQKKQAWSPPPHGSDKDQHDRRLFRCESEWETLRT